ncbi:hypothetical protein [Halobellus rufus]|uniref:hypothetical protein n=1 Tax=Halobellus rufus TaxID=1448860 RepID=UPI0018CDB938|nr:hypothetical protein [Halobellus rufus]
MQVGTNARLDGDFETGSEPRPEINVCESRPGRSIFLEDRNTDGWISSDLTVTVDR